MNIRQARKIADHAAPGRNHPWRKSEQRWPLATLIKAFRCVFKKWRSVTTPNLSKGDHYDADRGCTDDYFRGNRLAYLINYRFKGGGARVENVAFKPAARRRWIEKYGEPPR